MANALQNVVVDPLALSVVSHAILLAGLHSVYHIMDAAAVSATVMKWIVKQE